MKNETISLPIRSALIPIFYKNFHCLAQSCRDSCCVNWSIAFSKKDYLSLRRLDAPAELKDKLETYVRRERKQTHDGVLYGKFDLDSNKGRCPFLDVDGLCSIQRTCGETALPDVCRTYPRNIGYTAAAKEYTLSPSCEGVLQQLWDLPEGIEFVEDPLPKDEYRNVVIPAGENLELYFTPVRALCVDVLQNRKLNLPQRMLHLGLILKRLQEEDWDIFDPDVWERQAMLSACTDENIELAPEAAKARRLFLLQNLNVLNSIATTTKDWSDKIYTALDAKHEIIQQENSKLSTEFSISAYEDALTSFQAAFPEREYFFENLIIAAALYMGFPKLSNKNELWKSYVSLCSLYSFYRFVSVLGCKETATKEQLFHILVMASRATLHSRDRFNQFQDELFQHESSSLAHMAILLNI